MAVQSRSIRGRGALETVTINYLAGSSEAKHISNAPNVSILVYVRFHEMLRYRANILMMFKRDMERAFVHPKGPTLENGVGPRIRLLGGQWKVKTRVLIFLLGP
ncbi:hypothetical protein EYF80_013037 [Liparis tanakae]|uniref:Uncharacterized protein n=1 Tax=Liparis tanakae TaxID=230148 RepID=A0A4Z2IFR2_9TELE|nr:hypothetical protein EYF80_013037 [Liparis tanakae]